MRDPAAHRRIDELALQIESLKSLPGLEIAPPLRLEKIHGRGATLSLDDLSGSNTYIIGSPDGTSNPNPTNSRAYDAIIEIADGTPANGTYDAIIQSRDSTVPQFDDLLWIWALDLAGSLSLTAGDRYLALIVRDAAGEPVVEVGGNYFVSLVDTNKAQALDDTDYWLETSDDPADIEAWDAGTGYVAGDLASSGGTDYICILAHANQSPPSATYWLALATLTDRGPFVDAETYGQGDYVQQVRSLYAIRSEQDSDPSSPASGCNFGVSLGVVTARVADVLGQGYVQLYSASGGVMTPKAIFVKVYNRCAEIADSWICDVLTDPFSGLRLANAVCVYPDSSASNWYCMDGVPGEVVVIPGATCDVAGEVPLEYEFAGTIANGENHWLIVYPNSTSPCRIDWTSSTTSLAASFSESYSGDPCTPDLGLGSTTATSDCVDVTPDNTSSGIMLRVVASADGTYTFKVSIGSC